MWSVCIIMELLSMQDPRLAESKSAKNMFRSDSIFLYVLLRSLPSRRFCNRNVPPPWLIRSGIIPIERAEMFLVIAFST